MEMWKRWEHDLADYEIKYGIIEDSTKIAAVNKMMPIKMQECARVICHNISKYQDLKQFARDYVMNNPNPVKNNTDGIEESRIATKIPVQSMEDDNWEHNQTADVMFVGKGKAGNETQSKGKGKGYYPQWKGKPTWQWPSHKGQWATYWQQGNEAKGGFSSSKARNDKGGKGGKKGRECYKCGGKGHIARECPSFIQNIDEGFEDYEQKSHSCNEANTHQHADEAPIWVLQEQNDITPWIHVRSTRTSTALMAVEEREKERQKGHAGFRNKYSLLGEEIDEEHLDHVIEYDNGKAKIELTLDSGAANHLLPTEMFPKIKRKQHEAAKMGKCFYDAGGKPIPNEGEKTIQFLTLAGHKQRITWQVAKVVRPLLSMGKLEEANCKMEFEQGKRFIWVPATGEKIPVTKKNGTYKVNMWIDMDVVGPVF